MCALAALALLWGTASAQTSYPVEVLPAQHRAVRDSVTGAELVFLTDTLRSLNFYFHERSWLADESMILFPSERGLLGYLTATGELAVLRSPTGGFGGATAASRRNSFFCMRGGDILEVTPTVTVSADPAATPSTVTLSERVIATPEGGGQLNGSCDDRYVALGYGGKIVIIDTGSGEITHVCGIPPEITWAGHLQWSRTNPNLLSFAGGPDRIYVVDIRDGVIRNPYHHANVEHELVTHESWWVDDQILFCGSPRPHGRDESHVKVLNVYTGIVRVAGAGAWWPEGTPASLAKLNWWHASGSEDGRWIAADNWHGDIMLFEGRTTRPHLLTTGHRTYGHGEHPHVGWDRSGQRVIFAAHTPGGLRVCVARIPDEWQRLVDESVGVTVPRRD